MENLKCKLSQLNAESECPEIQQLIDDLASNLFNNYHILKGTEEYYFVNIEFYFCNKKHFDIITYPRDLEEGMWFFHESGIDLTFKSKYMPYNGNPKTVDTDKEFFFGGILVREILKKNDMENSFDGPYKCEWELFDKFNALNPSASEMPKLVANTTPLSLTTIRTKRHFSYNSDMFEKKYNELTNTIYHGNCQIIKEDFEKFIKNEELSYKVDKENLKSILMSL